MAGTGIIWEVAHSHGWHLGWVDPNSWGSSGGLYSSISLHVRVAWLLTWFRAQKMHGERERERKREGERERESDRKSERTRQKPFSLLWPNLRRLAVSLLQHSVGPGCHPGRGRGHDLHLRTVRSRRGCRSGNIAVSIFGKYHLLYSVNKISFYYEFLFINIPLNKPSSR